MLDQRNVFHRNAYPWLFVNAELSCRILLAVPMDEVKRAVIRFGDPFDFLQGSDKQPNLMETPMYLERKVDGEDYFVCTVMPYTRKLRYHFRLETINGTFWYAENGLMDKEDESTVRPFQVPYMYPAALYRSPNHAGKTVWYQIFPDRFADSKALVDPESFIPERTNFFGGDIRGIIQKLPYLQEIGITGLYLTPVFKSTSNHRYDTQDYLKVDPRLGTEADLLALSDAAHKANMKLMLDGVYNHAGWACKIWQDVLEKGDHSFYRDWFYIHDMQRTQSLSLDSLTSSVMKTSPPYDCFAFAANMPKWNTENPKVQEYLISTAERWTQKLRLDGWRLDVPDEVSMDFLRAFRRRIKAIHPDIYIAGEIWGSPDRWLMGDTFDGTMNYPLYFILRDFVLTGTDDAACFAGRMNRYLVSTPPEVRRNLLNFIGNHDLPRPLTVAKGNLDALKAALLLLFLQEGEICLYYGDEMAMAGGADPDNRRPICWKAAPVANDMQRTVQELISLRETFGDFQLAMLTWQAVSPAVARGTWQKEDGLLDVYVHNGSFETSVMLDFKADVLFGSGCLHDNHLLLPPHGAALLKRSL